MPTNAGFALPSAAPCEGVHPCRESRLLVQLSLDLGRSHRGQIPTDPVLPLRQR